MTIFNMLNLTLGLTLPLLWIKRKNMFNEKVHWQCPNCGNEDLNKLTVIRRTCGYLGLHFWNEGKTKEGK